MAEVLIANRGEIAIRIARACRDRGDRSIGVYVPADVDAPHVAACDTALALPDGGYLDIPALLDAAARSGATTVHPGYGFLSENAEFAAAVIGAGLVWVGPSPEVIALLGDKIAARRAAIAAGVPVVPGSDGAVADVDEVAAFTAEHGFPVALKAAAGGGGRGLAVVRDAGDLRSALDRVVAEAGAAFGRTEVFVERFVERARHVEVQIAADRHGTVQVLGTRDCSLQRRHQKLVEEAPAPQLPDGVAETLARSARELCASVGYVGVGTVEYLLDGDGRLAFLEVNTRLQVEHPVTEEVYGVDLVDRQFAIAAGERIDAETPPARGHAIEFRVNAEDPGRGFLPSPGRIDTARFPSGPGVRVDHAIGDGVVVGARFDSLLAKIIVTGPDRATTLRRARRVLSEATITGIATTLPFSRAVLTDPDFTDRFVVHTHWIETDGADLLDGPDPAYTDDEPTAGTVELPLELDGERRLVRVSRRVLTDWGLAEDATDDAEDAEDDPTVLSAEVPGELASWSVADGAQVAEGEQVAVIESMKLAAPVLAHRAGAIEQLAPPGDTVGPGHRLARIH